LIVSKAFTLGPKRDAALVFGCCKANRNNPFYGALDEVRLYDYTLSDKEVLGLAGQ